MKMTRFSAEQIAEPIIAFIRGSEAGVAVAERLFRRPHFPGRGAGYLPLPGLPGLPDRKIVVRGGVFAVRHLHSVLIFRRGGDFPSSLKRRNSGETRVAVAS